MDITGNGQGRPMSAERENAMLDASIDVLSEVGFEQLTVRAVCERAGASTKTAYRRWANKEELLAAALRRAVLREVEPEEVAAVGSSLRDDLIENLRHQATSFRGSVQLVLGLIVASQSSGELGDVAKLLVRKHDAHNAARILDAARARGEIGAGPEPEALADLARSIFLHHILVVGTVPTEDSIVAAVDGVLLPALFHAEAAHRGGATEVRHAMKGA